MKKRPGERPFKTLIDQTEALSPSSDKRGT